MANNDNSKRDFLKTITTIGALGSILPLSCRAKKLHVLNTSTSYIVLSKVSYIIGQNIEQDVEKAINIIGGEQGMGKFISRGDVVVIKPNIGWTRAPELAANTNPTVIKKIIELCFNAGASKVKVTDVSTHSAKMSFKASGIEDVCKEMGADLIYPDNNRFKMMKIPNGEAIKSWQIFQDIYESDKLINVPVAKQHNLSKLTLGMKNLYGAVGGVRSKLHQQIDTTIVDLADFFRPTLVIIDAIRIMTKNGPTGGSIKDTKTINTVLASTDQVAADSIAATLFNYQPEDLPFIVKAYERGLGEYRLDNISIEKFNLD